MNFVSPTSSDASLAAETLLRRRAIRRSYPAWCEYMMEKIGRSLAAHHRLIVQTIDDLVHGKLGKRRVIIMCPPGAAKALALDTPIPTPKGWSTIGEVRIGDFVFDEMGLPTRVIRKTSVFKNRPVYRVTTDSGESIIADEDHDWLVQTKRDKRMTERFELKKTFELVETWGKKPLVKQAFSLVTPTASLPIEPYLLGYWLGDGHSADGRITVGAEDVDYFKSEMTRLGHLVKGRTYDGRNFVFFVLGFRRTLFSLGLLGNKHIPSVYLRADKSQRLSLLQGLVDTDGTVNERGETCFTSSCSNLAEGVVELARSLGVKASITKTTAFLYGKDCGPVWRVRFYMEQSARMPRKSTKTKNGYRTPDTYLSVEPCGYADTMCIEVASPSHLFLVGKSMTPTHNSTYTSQLLPAWFVNPEQFPSDTILACSYSYSLAESFGRRARDILEEESAMLGVTISPTASAAGDWQTTTKGGYLAAGVGAGIAGRRAKLGLIDDYIGTEEEAQSKTVRDKIQSWYYNDFLPRLVPNAFQLIIANRRHEDDLIGRLMQEKDFNDKWLVIRLPMVAEKEDVDPLGRQPGERLWPEWFTEEQVADAKKDASTWAGLYQQRPAPEDGLFFKKDNILLYHSVNDLPLDLRKYVGSDYALKKTNQNDFTCFIPAGVDPNGRLWILPNIFWERVDTFEAASQMLEMAREVKPVSWLAGRENITGSIAPFLYKMMQETNTFLPIDELSESADKMQKAQAIRGRIQAGMVMFPAFAGWWERALHQMLSFPNGTHDDFVDALAKLGQGIAKIAPAMKRSVQPSEVPALRITGEWMERSQKRADRERRLTLQGW